MAVFEGRLWFFEEVKVRLIQDEAAIWSATNQLVVFGDHTHFALIVVDHTLGRFEVCESFKLSFQLTLLDLMEAFLIILIREVVDSDLPSLQQVGCS